MATPVGQHASSSHLISAALAGAFQTAFWHPLDLLKTRLQVQDARVKGGGLPAYHSLRHAVCSIVASEGPSGFWRGVLPNIFGSSLAWGCQMPLYTRLKQVFGEDERRERSLFFFAPRDLACSLTSGCITNVIVHPLFLIKTRMQLQPTTRDGDPVKNSVVKPAYRGTGDAIRSILREEGFVGLYRGFVPSLLLSTHGAVLLVSYDHFRALYPSVVVASLCAKIFATTATYPLQVVRSVMQQRPSDDRSFPYTSAQSTAKLLWSRGGVLAFYRGICPQLMRTVPQSVVFFSVYERVLSLFEKF